MKNGLLIIVLCFIFTHSHGQITEARAIDSIFTEWNQAQSPGCALGIIKNGTLVYSNGYGMANLEYAIPNTDSSVFRIGSTSKQFTAACVVLLAQQGKLSLDNTLDTFFPDFPEYAKAITVRHLLNHTSGIRDYLTVSYLKGFTDDDYYEDTDIMQWLIHQHDLNFVPGDEFLYSNSGYWLLGQIVERASGMNMADFAQQEIFTPLGMNSTHFHNDHTQIVKNRASGYVPSNGEHYKISMTTLDMIGDGGIFTTIGDIKKWDDAYYNSTVLDSAFWTVMTERGVLNNGEQLNYACGLSVRDYKGLKRISHGGAFVGFRAELMRFPDQRVTIAVFANRGDANPTAKANRVADILLKDAFIEEEETTLEVKDTAEEPSYALSRMTGTYEVDPGTVLVISLRNDTLYVLQSWNSASYPIIRVSGNTFRMADNDNISFSFSALADDMTQTLIILQNGREIVTQRKEGADHSDINLAAYAGSYFSSELDATYLIYMEDNKLRLKVRNNPAQEMTIYDKDQFTAEYGLLRFQRVEGAIAGFELDAGRVKNLKFEKRY